MPITGPPLYTGTWNCFVKTVQLEGFKALFKGIHSLKNLEIYYF